MFFIRSMTLSKNSKMNILHGLNRNGFVRLVDLNMKHLKSVTELLTNVVRKKGKKETTCTQT